jgi:hypothetical protein
MVQSIIRQTWQAMIPTINALNPSAQAEGSGV